MFIKLNSMNGYEIYINIQDIVFFFDHDCAGNLIKLRDEEGGERVKESAEQIMALIKEASK